MKIVKISAGAKFEVKEIESGYEAMQAEISGIITTGIISHVLRDCGIVMYADDEGILKNREITAVVVDKNYNVQQTLCGPLVFVGDDGMGGDKDLTDDQIALIKATLQKAIIGKMGSDETFEIFVVRSDY
mgnify:CR=1 FL=1